MNKINDGGPAFPHDEKHDDGSHYLSMGSMSLRDWFAGQALAGFAALSECDAMGIIEAARSAYAHADAMLAERSK